jgi:nucleoside-diphosphate-sugar epimerase
MTGTVLILGGRGKIGRHSAKAFAAAGWTVRQYKRGTDMTQEAKGADVIVNGLNPPNYHNWAVLIPHITTQVIAAAKASGATVILPGNVYNFGAEGGVWSEETLQRPVSRKGRIRVEMEAAYRSAGVQTIILRAGNFIDPEGQGDIMSLFILRDITRGKIVFGGAPDVMQAWCYLPDWARAAEHLARMRANLSGFEDIPFPGHSFTLSGLRMRLEEHLGRSLRVVRFPWWMMTIAAPFWELARELREIRYLWDTPHSLSDRKFNSFLPDFRHRPVEDVILDTLPPALRVADQSDAKVRSV